MMHWQGDTPRPRREQQRAITRARLEGVLIGLLLAAAILYFAGLVVVPMGGRAGL